MRIIKHLTAAALMMLLAAACTEEKTYRVTGTGDALKDGDTLFLTTDLTGLIPSDTIIVKSGQFTLSGQTDSTTFCLLYSPTNEYLAMPFFIEPGNIKIELPKELENATVSGTLCNNEWQVVNDTMTTMSLEMNRLAQQMYSTQEPEQLKKINGQMEQLNEKFKNFILDRTKKNIDNEFGYFLVTFYCQQLLTPAQCKELIDQLPAELRQRTRIKQLEEDIALIQHNNEGQFGDFKMNDLSGKEISLLDEVKKNKLTVVDFWASWCGPCRRSMPQMVALYGKFHEKGLGIIGISLDEDKDAWTKAVSELGMTWQQVSDLKGWDNAIAKSFNIRAIPHMMLVDQEGNIVKDNIDPQQLEELLAEKLN
ncbi:MAG: AhpC/TSA family protein [Prevotella sp.]|nr:AhpC/TSA family protein [Prevotella sp.]